jgi:hypothetical protein
MSTTQEINCHYLDKDPNWAQKIIPNNITILLNSNFQLNKKIIDVFDWSNISPCNYSDYICYINNRLFVKYFPVFYPNFIDSFEIDSPLVINKIDPQQISECKTTNEILKKIRETIEITHIPEPLFVYGYSKKKY